MTQERSNFIAANGANFKGTQVEFSRALAAASVSYDALSWLGNIQVYKLLDTPVAWYYSNRGYCDALATVDVVEGKLIEN